MTARAVAIRVHLALAVGLGAMMLILGISGAVLVFRDDLEPLFLPAVAPVQPRPERVPLQALVDAAQRSQPGLRPRALILPEAEGRPARVAMAGRPGEAPEVLVDPHSGAVLGARWRERSPLHALRLLHADLYLGTPGRAIVGLLGVAFLLQGLTGAYLWWPFTRRPSRGFAVRWNRGWPVVGYDVHKAVGAASLAFNLPIALTGALLGLSALAPASGWPSQAGDLAPASGWTPGPGAAGAGAAAAQVSRRPGHSRASLPVDVIAARGLVALPGRLVSVTLPADVSDEAGDRGPGNGVAIVRMALPGDLDRRGTGLVLIERATGEALAVHGGRRAPVSTRLWDVVAPLHHGDFGGTPAKLLYAAGGLTAPVLVLTGYAVRLGRGRTTTGRLRSFTDRG